MYLQIIYRHCDGNFDCDGDNSDERGCYFGMSIIFIYYKKIPTIVLDSGNIVSPSTSNNTNNSDICGPNKFFCYKSNQCILRYFFLLLIVFSIFTNIFF